MVEWWSRHLSRLGSGRRIHTRIRRTRIRIQIRTGTHTHRHRATTRRMPTRHRRTARAWARTRIVVRTGRRVRSAEHERDARPGSMRPGPRVLCRVLYAPYLVLHRDGIRCRHHRRRVLVRVSLGELRAEKKDLSGVVDPHEHDDKRARRAERRSYAAPPEIQANENLAECEKHRRGERADPDVAPGDPHIG